MVEGYLDAIALWQAGIHHVVASLGTAFTEDQVVRLWKFAPEPVICFDGDAAGVSAAHRAIDRIFPVLKSGYSFQFCFLPDGMDPDDLIKQRGVAGFHDEVERAQSLFDVVWEREISVSRLDTPERKAALEKRFDDLIATIRDERVRRRYQLDLKFKLSNLFFEQARQSRQGARGGKGGGSADAASPLGTARERVAASHDFGTERLVLGLSMRFPHLLDRNFERFSRLPFANDLHRQLRDILCRIVDDLEATPISDLTSAFEEPLRNIMGEMMLETIGMQQQRGAEFSALIHRFPLLKSNPPEDFIEAAYLHFLDVLELNALEDELSSELATADEQLDEHS